MPSDQQTEQPPAESEQQVSEIALCVSPKLPQRSDLNLSNAGRVLQARKMHISHTSATLSHPAGLHSLSAHQRHRPAFDARQVHVCSVKRWQRCSTRL